VLDGVYDTTGEVPMFHPVRAPTAEQLQTLTGCTVGARLRGGDSAARETGIQAGIALKAG
jgi:hypothetical protein